jgi:3-phosphoshikimate 1-carboxyvinyltransferase
MRESDTRAILVEGGHKLAGFVTAPPSKSHTLRAILFGSLASGTTRVRNWLRSPDTDAMIQACLALGASIAVQREEMIIHGLAGMPRIPDDVIDAGNSGQVLRFIAAIAAHVDGYVVLTGDHSIRHQRPLEPLIEGLNGLGIFAISTKRDGHAPIVVGGPWRCGTTECDGYDSQPVSALLIAAAFAEGETYIRVREPGEKPWVELTLHWLRRLGIEVESQYGRGPLGEMAEFRVHGRRSQIKGFDYQVPGDFSSAAFPVAAALVTRSELCIAGLDMDDCQGDKAILDVFHAMGARFEYDPTKSHLVVKRADKLVGTCADVNDHIDSVCVLSAVGCFALGRTVLSGAAVARLKESDRIATMAAELRKLGAAVEPTSDGMIVEHRSLRGDAVLAHSDHRVAMALTVAGLGAEGQTTVIGSDCIAKSYESFVDDLNGLGARVSHRALKELHGGGQMMPSNL